MTTKTKGSNVMEEDWRNLLESSRAINLGQDGSFQINRSLRGIEAEAQRLSSSRSRRAQTVHVSNTQLKDFAMRAGVDIQNQRQCIQRIATTVTHDEHDHDLDMKAQRVRETETERADTAATPLIRRRMAGRGRGTQVVNSMDLENFLRDHHEYVVSSSITKCQQLSSIKFRKKYELSMHEEWHNTKLDILHFLQSDGYADEQEDGLDIDANGVANLSLLDYPKFVSLQQQHQQMQ